jgi:hypothetical protein
VSKSAVEPLASVAEPSPFDTNRSASSVEPCAAVVAKKTVLQYPVQVLKHDVCVQKPVERLKTLPTEKALLQAAKRPVKVPAPASDWTQGPPPVLKRLAAGRVLFGSTDVSKSERLSGHLANLLAELTDADGNCCVSQTEFSAGVEAAKKAELAKLPNEALNQSLGHQALLEKLLIADRELMNLRNTVAQYKATRASRDPIVAPVAAPPVAVADPVVKRDVSPLRAKKRTREPTPVAQSSESGERERSASPVRPFGNRGNGNRGNGNGRDNSRDEISKLRYQLRMATTQCHRCQEMGHMADTCTGQIKAKQRK